MKKNNIKDNVLEIIEKGEIQLDQIHDLADDFVEEAFDYEYPDYDEKDVRSLHVEVLKWLEVQFWIFPEEILLVKKALTCSAKHLKEVRNEWDNYWEQVDYTTRHSEGKKRGYWN